MLCSEENMELLQVEMSHKEKENTRLKEEIEEQKRSRLETERELKEEITELQEELARLHQRFRKEIENIIEERDQYAIEFRTLQQETRERLVDPPDHLMPNLFTIFEPFFITSFYGQQLFQILKELITISRLFLLR